MKKNDRDPWEPNLLQSIVIIALPVSLLIWIAIGYWLYGGQ